ncbi:hypothetical protein BV898_18509 [Hypsibius exemplaris]|uniref:Uncharacterized protein n=1 Tax=Hypsibius exemplaris TaxID=2072580 RepID=A0A9X6NH17_HYPEX|nr:hypothetical protein BV898_18509 [Hypsibius exemplaris]
MHRLVRKIVNCRVMSAIGKLFRPQQLDYGALGGEEAVVHFTRAFLSEKKKTQLFGTMRSRLSACYVDEETIGNSVDMVMSDLRLVIDMGKQIGWSLTLPSVRPRFCREELSLLGALLLPKSITTAMDTKTATLCVLTSRLNILQAHQGFFHPQELPKRAKGDKDVTVRTGVKPARKIGGIRRSSANERGSYKQHRNDAAGVETSQLAGQQRWIWDPGNE